MSHVSLQVLQPLVLRLMENLKFKGCKIGRQDVIHLVEPQDLPGKQPLTVLSPLTILS